MCHRCASSGSWYDLKRRAGSGGARLLGSYDCKTAVLPSTSSGRRTSAPRRAGGDEVLVAQQRAAGLRPVPDQQRVRSYPANLMHNPRFDGVKAYLSGIQAGQRGIQPEVLIKYGVGCAAYRRDTGRCYSKRELHSNFSPRSNLPNISFCICCLPSRRSVSTITFISCYAADNDTQSARTERSPKTSSSLQWATT